MRYLIPIMVLTVLVSTAAAQESQPPGQLVIGAYGDNDSNINPVGDSDQWYTNGVGLSLSWSLDPQTTVPWLPLDDDFQRRALGLVVGQLMFTPRNIRAEDPDPDDHPYAGYLFAGLFYQRANDTTLDHLQVEVGVIGPLSLAADAQKWVHSFTDAPDPQGWGDQIDDEAAVQVYLRRKWRGSAELGGNWLAQAIPQIGLGVGTVQRRLEAGIVGRVGFNIPDDFGPGRLLDPTTAATADPQRQPKGLGVYLFTRLSGYAVEHDVFVEGSEFHGGPGVDEEPLVGEWETGIVVGYARGRVSGELGWSKTYVTKQFEGQHGAHDFGSINGRFTIAF